MAKRQAEPRKPDDPNPKRKRESNTQTVYFGKSPIPREVDKNEAKRLIEAGRVFEKSQAPQPAHNAFIRDNRVRVIIIDTGQLQLIPASDAATLVSDDKAIYYHGPTKS